MIINVPPFTKEALKFKNRPTKNMSTKNVNKRSVSSGSAELEGTMKFFRESNPQLISPLLL